MLLGCPLGLGVTLTVPVQEKGSVLVPLGENVIQDLQGETPEVTREPSTEAPAGSTQGCLTAEGWDGPLGRQQEQAGFQPPKRWSFAGCQWWTPSRVGHPSAVSTKNKVLPLKSD